MYKNTYSAMQRGDGYRKDVVTSLEREREQEREFLVEGPRRTSEQK